MAGFDGIHDSLYHEFDVAGNRHMEYIRERGEHLDLPYDEMMAVFRSHYPRMIAALSQGDSDTKQSERWEQEVSEETAP